MLNPNHYPELKELIERLNHMCNYQKVKTSIEYGDTLCKLKSYIPHGEWIPFVEKTFNLRKRSIQKYMRLSKNTVNEKYWNLGIDNIEKLLSMKYDLSIFNEEYIRKLKE